MEFKRFALAMMGHFLASLLYVLNRLHLVDAVVDTTSILEHREELRDLWEKRMMSDDNQSSPSSAVEEKKTAKTPAEEATEGESPDPAHSHLSNGFAKAVEESDQPAPEEPLVETAAADAEPVKDDRQETSSGNNCVDSLEADSNNEVLVEERTYTSQLETCLVVKQVTAEQEGQLQTMHNDTVSDEPATAEVDGHQLTATASDVDTPDPVGTTQEEGEQAVSPGNDHDEKPTLVDLGTTEIIAPMKSLEIPTPTDEEGDGFVPLAECLPLDDEAGDETQPALEELSETKPVETHKELTNGYGSHSMSELSAGTPEPCPEGASHPEMEQFVKSGGVKRILPGVQKTEQPYSSCTTETKIAMEIREMREREEELRIMREQALLSPVVSPVPPKSPASPSPSVKDCASPTPAGPGYRVSSVFGHKGSVSPQPPVVAAQELIDRRSPFKVSPAVETAVEREIRLAKDREEELRRQKGLPPREDDSYVKPSQVKSSQVRIFGKAVGSVSVKNAATAKIQLEIEEQTQREMALREVGSIQTISQERTDAKVTKLLECTTPPPATNGSSPVNGSFTNGRHSPDVVAPYKRCSPSPNGRPASIFSSSQTNGGTKGVSMQKFIASKGRDFSVAAAPSKNGAFVVPREEKVVAVPPTMIKLKRTVSVESKIQQEIMEMKQREEELKKLHMNRSNGNSNGNNENEMEFDMNQKNALEDYENGNGHINDEDLSPRHNKLIAQWEQRCQKLES